MNISDYFLEMDFEARVRLSTVISEIRGNRSQREFARVLGVSYAALRTWEKCESVPGLENLKVIAAAAGLTLEQLLHKVKGKEAESAAKTAKDIMPLVSQLSPEETAKLVQLMSDQQLATLLRAIADRIE